MSSDEPLVPSPNRAVRWVGAVPAALALAIPAGIVAAPASAATAESYSRPASGSWTVTGHGWGHGRGMSQWGASVASTKGVSYSRILSTYYPGTTLTTTSTDPTVRVWLESLSRASVSLRASRTGTLSYAASDGSTVRVPARPTGEVAPAACGTRAVSLVRVKVSGSRARIDAYCGAWQAWIPKSAIKSGTSVTATDSTGIVGVKKSASVRSGYRGSVRITPVSGRTRVVVRTSREDYLRAVVPSEMPTSWGAQALRAQAVAARTYVASSARSRASSFFDVYDSTKSQAYPGAVAYGSSKWNVSRKVETAASDKAISATRTRILTVKGVPIHAEFTSSNGGVTAAGTSSYLRSAADSWDAAATKNPYRAWTTTLKATTLQARYPALGTLRSIRVNSREGIGEDGGRLSSVTLVGSSGSVTLGTAEKVRVGLGLRSTYATFAATPTPAPSATPTPTPTPTPVKVTGTWWRPVPAGIAIGTAFGVSGPLWSSGKHTGLDFRAPAGTAALAAGPGTVTTIGTTGAYGLSIRITHPDGRVTLYAHLNAILVRLGDKVTGGQQIGRTGTTGNSTGNHMHFEVRVGGIPVDPAPYVAVGTVITAPARVKAPFDTRPMIAYDSQDPSVRTVQSALSVSPVSGYFGTLTKAAVVKLQKANGLPQTGIMDVATWDAMLG